MLLGEGIGDAVALSIYGKIAEAVWRALPKHFAGIEIDTLAVMPNHIHVVVSIFERVSGGTPAGHQASGIHHSRHCSGIVGRHCPKLSSRSRRGRINQVRHTPGAPVWQRNYYEHVIRTSAEPGKGATIHYREPAAVGIG